MNLDIIKTELGKKVMDTDCIEGIYFNDAADFAVEMYNKAIDDCMDNFKAKTIVNNLIRIDLEELKIK